MNERRKRVLIYLIQLTKLHNQTLTEIAVSHGHGDWYISEHLHKTQIVDPQDYKKLIPYLPVNDFIAVYRGSNEPFKHILNVYRKRIDDRRSFLDYLNAFIHIKGYSMNQMCKQLGLPSDSVSNIVQNGNYPRGIRFCYHLAKALGVSPNEILVPFRVAYSSYRRTVRHRLVDKVNNRKTLTRLYQCLCRMNGWTFSQIQRQTGLDIIYTVRYKNSHDLKRLLKALAPYFKFTPSECQILEKKFNGKRFLVLISRRKDSFPLIHDYLRVVTLEHHDSLNNICVRNGHCGSYVLNLLAQKHPIAFYKINKLIPYVPYLDLKRLTYGDKAPLMTVMSRIKKHISNREDFIRYMYAVCIVHKTSLRQLSVELYHQPSLLKNDFRVVKAQSLKPHLIQIAKYFSIDPRDILSPLDNPKVALPESTIKWPHRRTKIEQKHTKHQWALRLEAKVNGPKSLLRYTNLICHLHGMTLSKVSQRMGHTKSYMEVAIGRNYAFKIINSFKQVAHILNVNPAVFITPLLKMYGATDGVHDRKSLLHWVDVQAHVHGYLVSSLCRRIGRGSSYLSGCILSHKPETIKRALKAVAPYLFISDWACNELPKRINEPSVYSLSPQEKIFNQNLFSYCRILTIADNDNISRISLRHGHSHDYLSNLFLTKLTDNAIDNLLNCVPNLTRRAVDLIKIGDYRPIKSALRKIAHHVSDRTTFLRYVRCICLAHGYTLAQISVYYGHSKSNGLSALRKSNRYDIKLVCQRVISFLGLKSDTFRKPLRRIKANKSIHMGAPETSITRRVHMRRATKLKAVRLNAKSSVKQIADQSWMTVPLLSKTLYHDPAKIDKIIQNGSLAENAKMLKYLLKASGMKSSVTKRTLNLIRQCSE